MKKIFLIFGMAGCLSVVNGINNANAVQSDDVIVTYTCPAGCELRFGHNNDGKTFAWCEKSDGTACADPKVNISMEAISPVTPVVNATDLKPSKINNKVNSKKLNKTSARAAETPRMVKKVVYEQIIEEDEE